ncbi:GntR family transcriptional regulator, partial [Staphylococcus pseudintermedius]
MLLKYEKIAHDIHTFITNHQFKAG